MFQISCTLVVLHPKAVVVGLAHFNRCWQLCHRLCCVQHIFPTYASANLRNNRPLHPAEVKRSLVFSACIGTSGRLDLLLYWSQASVAIVRGGKFEEFGWHVPAFVFRPVMFIKAIIAPLTAMCLYMAMAVFVHFLYMSLFLFDIFVAAHRVLVLIFRRVFTI